MQYKINLLWSSYEGTAQHECRWATSPQVPYPEGLEPAQDGNTVPAERMGHQPRVTRQDRVEAPKRYRHRDSETRQDSGSSSLGTFPSRKKLT